MKITLNKIGCVACYIAMLFGIEAMVFQSLIEESAINERINLERAAKAKMTDEELIDSMISYKYAPELMNDRGAK